MSKASKSRRAIQRRKEKKARKESNKARYESFVGTAQNKKSKRGAIKAKKARRHQPVDHPDGRCPNTGCSRCSDVARTMEEKYQTKKASVRKLHLRKRFLAGEHYLETLV